jgi:hypothetical protein
LFLVFTSCFNQNTSTIRIPASSADSACTESVRALIPVNPIKSGLIKTGQNSLGMKIPNFSKFRSDMIEIRPSLDKFPDKYRSLNQGTEPTFKEAIEYFIESNNKLAVHIRSAKGHNSELDHYLEYSAANIDLTDTKINSARTYLTDRQNRRRLSENFNIKDSVQRTFFDSLGWTNYKGHLGELDVLLRLENLQAQSMYLTRAQLLNPKAQAVSNILATALEKKLRRITVSDIPSLKRKFPKVFKSKPGESNQIVLEKGIMFLETKELDLIIKKNNKYSVVEVKNYKRPIDHNDVKISSGSKKTILDQQLETIQTLEFLGLEDLFFPTVAFLRGVRPQAKSILEEEGISVLAKVIE